jgi:hypothetical protein
MIGKELGIKPIPRRGGVGYVHAVKLGRRRRVIYVVLMLNEGRLRSALPKDLVVLPKPRKRRRMKQ